MVSQQELAGSTDALKWAARTYLVAALGLIGDAFILGITSFRKQRLTFISHNIYDKDHFKVIFFIISYIYFKIKLFGIKCFKEPLQLCCNSPVTVISEMDCELQETITERIHYVLLLLKIF